ncbi:MAG: hypothetical protein AMK72_02985 [Planctomycetes bacterium SM23_25]|nr:MAG: hypothetical protein AMK72_02985 [Planctomycetes bacterium SM23_25]
MVRYLPSRPSLENLRKQAKALLRDHRAKVPSACEALRRLRRFATADDEDLLASDVSLQEAQFALAMEYGFATWNRLIEHVERSNRAQAGPSPAPVDLPPGTQVLPGVQEIYLRTQQELEPLNHRRTNLVVRLAILRSMGIDGVDYATMMVLAGFATSFAYHPKQYNVMYFPPEDPLRHERRLARLVGLEWELLQRNQQDVQWRTDGNSHKLQSAEQAWHVVKTSVDAGKPIQATFMDDYILIGYQDADRAERRKVYSVGGWDPPCWWDWVKLENYVKQFGRFGRPGGRFEPSLPREIASEVIRGMVEYWDNDGRKALPWVAPGEGKYGAEGLETLAADTANLGMKVEDFDAGWIGCHCMYRQITGRPAAAEYLRSVAGELGSAGEHLLKAAAQYDAAWQHWLEWGRQLGQGAGVTEAKELRKLWADPNRRAAGAEAIRAAAACEQSAWESLGKAVKRLAGQAGGGYER